MQCNVYWARGCILVYIMYIVMYIGRPGSGMGQPPSAGPVCTAPLSGVAGSGYII